MKHTIAGKDCNIPLHRKENMKALILCPVDGCILFKTLEYP
jgi:hypothetical protein